MKQFRSLLCVVAAIIVIGLASCSKSGTGSTGPAGPPGPDSVIYSAWITLNFTYDAADTTIGFEETIQAPNITAGILDSGVILSYIQFTDTANVVHIQSIS